MAAQFTSDAERRKALAEARQRVFDLETGEERVSRSQWFDLNRYGLQRACIDLGIYKYLSDAQKPVHIDELAKSTGAEPRLLTRMLRFMVVDKQVDEKGVNLFAANKVTRVLARPEFEGLIGDMSIFLPMGWKLPEFLKENSYTDPKDHNDSAFKKGLNTDKHYFEWINLPGNEHRLKNFENHMTAKNLRTRPWFQTMNVADVLGTVTGADDVLMIDIGGNLGGDIRGLQERIRTANNNEIQGRLILQDLPTTVENARNVLPAGIEARSYDFFTPQPVRGARSYFMHMVLHDWPTHKCVEILRNQVPAMRKGFSKILINDIVLPEQNPEWVGTGIDILMMAVHSATERTETEWRALIEAAGLKMVKIWDCDGEAEKIIEAELP